jgi:WD40 repeat protein
VRSLQFSGDGQILISGSWDKTVKLWSVATGEVIHSLTTHKLQVTAVALSPDGQWLASGSCDRTVQIWHCQTGLPQFHCTCSSHLRAVNSVVFSPDSRMIATGSDDNTIKLWQVQTGHLQQTFTGHSWSVAALAFSADGNLLASGSWDHTVQLWQPDGTRLASLIGHSDSVTGVAIALETMGSWILSSGRDRQINIWLVPQSGKIKNRAFRP